MDLTVNDINYQVPFDLADIKLGDFIAYQEEYGSEIDQQLISLQNKKYDGDKDEIELQKTLDFENHLDIEALAWFSFWTKHDLFEVKDQPFIAPVLEKYRLLRFLIKDQLEDDQIEFPVEIEWNNETWMIDDFKVNPASEMSFNEIVTSKETMRQLHAIGKGRWQALIYLCAIYFRKKDEPFIDQFTHEGGERMELLKSLPLMHAIKVAFFLTGCLSIWKKIFLFSTGGEAETPNLN